MNVLTDRLIYWILLAGLFGFLFPGPAAAGGFLVPWLLFTMMLGLGLTLKPGDFRGALRWREAAAALGVQLVAIPGTALALRLMLPPGPLSDGVLVLGLVPAEITSALMVGLAGGDVPLSTMLLVLSMVVSLLVIPFTAGPQAAGALSIELLLSVLLPLGIGILVRARYWRPSVDACWALSAASVVGLVFIACAPLKGVDVVSLVTLAGLALVMVASGFGWGALAARLVGVNGRALVSFAFFGGMREFGVAAAVALSAYPAGAALPAAVYGPVMMLAAGTVASRLRRRHSERAAEIRLTRLDMGKEEWITRKG
ncbi:MAG: hypothetical protein M1582_04615 [Actinobacteria bacterium]|nr:hypothetical protein [Actinomycetota bacterium]